MTSRALHPILAALAAPVIALGGIPAAAQELVDINLTAERGAIEAFQAVDQKLQNAGWKLAHGNASFCPKVVPSIGLQMQDLASYGRPEIARAALGLKGDFAVQTAAIGSPAAQAKAFTLNREITALGDLDPNAWPAGERLYWQRLARAHDWVENALGENGRVSISFSDGEQSSVEPVPVCATRFELAGAGDRAVADGARVVIGVRFEGFAYEEPMLAAAIAHELAHNLLNHRAWLERTKRKRRHIRATEREADRLMPWLLANAGYDPAIAMRFFEQYRPSSGSVLFVKGSHEGWKKRMTLVRKELPRILALLESEGRADWSVHFEREINPDKGQ